MVKLKPVSLLRKKLRLALGIRIFLLLIVPVTLYVLQPIVTTNTPGDTRESSRIKSFHSSLNNRKLLSIVEDSTTDASRTTTIHYTNSTKYAINTTETTRINTSKQPTSNDDYDETNINCTAPAIDEFPPDGFTREQRQQGWITLHIVLVCYCFWFLAIICDDYFVPAIENMCASK